MLGKDSKLQNCVPFFVHCFIIVFLWFSWRKKCKFKKSWGGVQAAMRAPPQWKISARNLVASALKRESARLLLVKQTELQQGREALEHALGFIFLWVISIRHTGIHVLGMPCFHRYKTNIPICLHACTKSRCPSRVFRGFVLGYINLFSLPWLSMNSGSAAGTHFRNIKLIW